MRIGKMLIMSDEHMNEAKVFYAKFPPDIDKRNVLLMYPIMCMYSVTLHYFASVSISCRCFCH